MLGRSSKDIRLSEIIEIAGEVIPPRDLSILTEAQNYDDYYGIILDDVKDYQYKDGGTCVKFINDGDWIAFHDVDFDQKFKNIVVLGASDFEGNSIELRLDSPDGVLLGVCKVNLNSKETWQKSIFNLNQVRGKYDLFIKATGNLKLKHFRILL